MYSKPILSEVFGPSGIDDHAQDVFAAQLPRLMAWPGVVGVGLGMRIREGELEAGDGVCLSVMVRRKRSRNALRADVRLPKQIGGLPVDVIGGAPREQRRDASFTVGPEVVTPGDAIATDGAPPASAGGIVQDAAGRKFLLTAGHALIRPRKAFVRGIPVRLQADLATASGARQIGVTSDVHFGLDCGTVALTTEGQNLANLSLVPIGRPKLPIVGDTLEKSGARTGITQAVIVSIGRLGPIYPAMVLTPPTPDFDPDPLSLPGDSGSVWYDAASRAAVGLHIQGDVARANAREFGVATPIERILHTFRAEWSV